MLEISKSEIRSVLNMKDAITAMEVAFSELSQGLIISPLRTSIELKNNCTILIMPAFRNEGKYFTTKIVSVYKKAGQSKMISAHVNVYSSKNGELIATLDGNEITSIRTGAASALATKLFSKKNKKIAAIFGTGEQAKTQVEGLLQVSSIKKVLIYSRSSDSAEKFLKWINLNFEIDVSIAELDQLIEADIICTATPADSPLFEEHHIKPGIHINAIGSFEPSLIEISPKVIISSKIIVDQKEACTHEAGDLINAEKNHNWSFDNIYTEIGEYINADKPLILDDDRTTIFKSVGIAAQDLIISEIVLERLGTFKF